MVLMFFELRTFSLVKVVFRVYIKVSVVEALGNYGLYALSFLYPRQAYDHDKVTLFSVILLNRSIHINHLLKIVCCKKKHLRTLCNLHTHFGVLLDCCVCIS